MSKTDYNNIEMGERWERDGIVKNLPSTYIMSTSNLLEAMGLVPK